MTLLHPADQLRAAARARYGERIITMGPDELVGEIRTHGLSYDMTRALVNTCLTRMRLAEAAGYPESAAAFSDVLPALQQAHSRAALALLGSVDGEYYDL